MARKIMCTICKKNKDSILVECGYPKCKNWDHLECLGMTHEAVKQDTYIHKCRICKGKPDPKIAANAKPIENSAAAPTLKRAASIPKTDRQLRPRRSDSLEKKVPDPQPSIKTEEIDPEDAATSVGKKIIFPSTISAKATRARKAAVATKPQKKSTRKSLLKPKKTASIGIQVTNELPKSVPGSVHDSKPTSPPISKDVDWLASIGGLSDDSEDDEAEANPTNDRDTDDDEDSVDSDGPSVSEPGSTDSYNPEHVHNSLELDDAAYMSDLPIDSRHAAEMLDEEILGYDFMEDAHAQAVYKFFNT